jgi:replication-associated recombination protein RarA
MEKRMSNDFLWVEKYRPRKVADTILPASLKKTFQQIVDSGEMQNMLFTGTAGLGKTTVAKALCNELGCDLLSLTDLKKVILKHFVVRLNSLLHLSV